MVSFFVRAGRNLEIRHRLGSLQSSVLSHQLKVAVHDPAKGWDDFRGIERGFYVSSIFVGENRCCLTWYSYHAPVYQPYDHEIWYYESIYDPVGWRLMFDGELLTPEWAFRNYPLLREDPLLDLSLLDMGSR